MHAYIHARKHNTRKRQLTCDLHARNIQDKRLFNISWPSVHRNSLVYIYFLHVCVRIHHCIFCIWIVRVCASLPACFCIVRVCACLHATNSTEVETGIQHKMKPRCFVISWYKSNREHVVMIEFVLYKHAQISMSEKNKMETSVCRSSREWVGGYIFERHKRERDP